MGKFYLLTITMYIVSLCACNLYAQGKERKLTLEEIFQLASENSKQLKVSEANINVSRASTQVLKNNRLPSLDVSLSVSYLGNGAVIDRDFSHTEKAPMPHFGNNLAFEASQVIFAGGSISSSIANAELYEQIAQLAYDKNVMDIRFLLAGYYLQLYKLKNQREVYEKNIEQTNLLIKQISAKQQEGMALKNDITRHELTLQNYELAIIEIDNSYEIINHHLTVTLGLPQGTMIVPDESIIETDVPVMSTEDLLFTARESLPELKTANVNTQVAENSLRIAKAGYWPSVAIVASNHMDGPITIEIPTIDKNFNYWYVGIGIKYNLASLFKSGKNVSQAREQRQLAHYTKELLNEQTETGIHSALVTYRETFEKLHTFEKSMQLANENYNVINNRYLNDLVLITEMLDAANTRLTAELQVINAKIDIIYNYYKLQRTIGKL